MRLGCETGVRHFGRSREELFKTRYAVLADVSPLNASRDRVPNVVVGDAFGNSLSLETTTFECTSVENEKRHILITQSVLLGNTQAKRWDRAFSSDVRRRVVFVRRLAFDEFVRLAQLADVVLSQHPRAAARNGRNVNESRTLTTLFKLEEREGETRTLAPLSLSLS